MVAFSDGVLLCNLSSTACVIYLELSLPVISRPPLVQAGKMCQKNQIRAMTWNRRGTG